MRRSTLFLFAVLVLMGAILAEWRFNILANLAAEAAFTQSVGWVQGLEAQHIYADSSRQTITVEALTYHVRDLSLSIGCVTLPFSRQAMLADLTSYVLGARDLTTRREIGTIVMRNVAVGIGDSLYAIGTIKLTGVTISEADLEDILDPTVTRSAADAFIHLNATEVAIPQIAIKTGHHASPAFNLTLKNIDLQHILDGIAGTATIESANVDRNDLGGHAALRQFFGKTRFVNLNLPVADRVFFESRTSDNATLESLCSSLSIDGIDVTEALAHAKINIGAISIQNLKARPLERALFSSRLSSDTLPRQGSDVVIDLLESIQISTADVENVQFSVSLNSRNFTGNIPKAFLADVQPTKIAMIGLRHLKMTVDDSDIGQSGTLEIAKFQAGDIDLVELKKQLKPHPFASAVLANFSPGAAFATVREAILEGFSFVGSSANTDSRLNEPTSLKLARFKYQASGSPETGASDFLLVLDHFMIDPGASLQSMPPPLTAFGYRTFDISGQLRADFDAAEHQLSLEDLSLGTTEAGTIRLAGVFADATNDLFSVGVKEATAAALAMRVERLSVNFVDTGLFRRIVAAEAERRKIPPEAVRVDFLHSAQAMSSAFLRANAAKSLNSALTRFFTTSKAIEVTVSAPTGLRLNELLHLSDPNTMLAKLSVEARAD